MRRCQQVEFESQGFFGCLEPLENFTMEEGADDYGLC